MTLPNFLVIGAPKCGTTSVYEYLRQHPDVFMPDNKEPMFLAYERGIPKMARTRRVVTELAAYEALFAPATRERAIGEASTIYLYWPDALDGIHRHVPDAKLIAILRDPIERAYSNFVQQRLLGAEPLDDFEAALRAEPEHVALNWAPFWHYAALGRYHSQLVRFHRAFGRERLRTYLHDELEADPVAVIRDMYRFLGVDDGFVPDVSRRYNVTDRPHGPGLARAARPADRLTELVRPWLPSALRGFLTERETAPSRVRPGVDPNVRRRLIADFRDDISKLAVLLDKDLSRWLEPVRDTGASGTRE